MFLRDLFSMTKNIFNQGLYNENKNASLKNVVSNQETEKQNWEITKLQISKIVKEIVWKAWIEPIQFLEYKNKILYLSASSALISSRAETQYYETIFFEANKFFDNLKRIKIVKINSIKEKNLPVEQNNIDKNISINTKAIMPFIDSISIKLNSKLTFENFVVGNSNQMPFAASKRMT